MLEEVEEGRSGDVVRKDLYKEKSSAFVNFAMTPKTLRCSNFRRSWMVRSLMAIGWAVKLHCLQSAWTRVGRCFRLLWFVFFWGGHFEGAGTMRGRGTLKEDAWLLPLAIAPATGARHEPCGCSPALFFFWAWFPPLGWGEAKRSRGDASGRRHFSPKIQRLSEFGTCMGQIETLATLVA